MIPWRAISIIPDDMMAPRTTPRDAIISTVRNLATLAPMADWEVDSIVADSYEEIEHC